MSNGHELTSHHQLQGDHLVQKVQNVEFGVKNEESDVQSSEFIAASNNYQFLRVIPSESQQAII